MSKKIINVNSIPFKRRISNNRDENVIVHIALCEDGTLYQISGTDRGIAADSNWLKIKEIPDDIL